jgi:uncharacterized protein YraI
MVLRPLFSALLIFAGLTAAAPAAASTAHTIATVNMRAGPSIRYARIAVLPAGSRVAVSYCHSTRSWCKVRWRGLRGWVSRRYLRFVSFQPRYYPRPPAIYFDFRSRRWHDDHDRWHKRRPYPRRKADRRRWNRDHDRIHRPPPKRKKRIIRRRSG